MKSSFAIWGSRGLLWQGPMDIDINCYAILTLIVMKMYLSQGHKKNGVENVNFTIHYTQYKCIKLATNHGVIKRCP